MISNSEISANYCYTWRSKEERKYEHSDTCSLIPLFKDTNTFNAFIPLVIF